ncbi:hypothetical protein GQ44DRAFT_718575, partial [Phaeosphaeriaceae sp. PMI808]
EIENNPFTSGLIYFLARLRLAQDYSYILAGIVYCIRVLSAKILLLAAWREQ